MCGICGYLGDGDEALLKKMFDVLKHRGPDENGLHTDTQIGLGNTRLSIIDLQTGRQPIYNEDKSICVVNNGEIYNFEEMTRDLEQKGHHFYTRSDTEVLVHAYEEYGPEFVKILNGMFAFAIWDSNLKRLMLARDRVGIKPLHYTILDDGTLIFSSEVKAILQHPEVRREIDPQALHELINLRYIARQRTMFRNIYRLLPGHYLLATLKGERRIEQFWRPVLHPTINSEEEAVALLKQSLRRAVKRNLVSDVPLGIYLSGGLDTSTIVALASEVGGATVHTFTMGFGDVGDENRYAQLVADQFDTDHHELIVDAKLLSEFPRMIWHAEEPKRNLYPYYIARKARQYVKTILGGLGGDEIFGGYIFKYEHIGKVENLRRSVSPPLQAEYAEAAKKVLDFQTVSGHIVDTEINSYLDMVAGLSDDVNIYLIFQTLDRVFSDAELQKIYSLRMLQNKFEPLGEIYRPFFDGDSGLLDHVMLADFAVKLPDDFLLVDDRMSMANSLEERVPLLDNELIDLCFNVPSELKIGGGVGKHLLRQAVKDILPPEIVNRDKAGFTAGIYTVYLKELREAAQQLLPDGVIVKNGYFNRDYIVNVLREKPNPRLWPHYNVIWDLYAYEMWYRIFIESDDLAHPNLNINKYT